MGTVAAVSTSVRAVSVLLLEPAVLLVIVRLVVFSFSVAAAVPIPMGLISATSMVITTLVIARGEAARHARG